MSDQELKAVEQVWHHTGSPGDEADYLKLLLRAGRLTPDDIYRAACLGHEASLIVHGEDVDCMQSLDSLLKWANSFAHDRALLGRVALLSALDFFESWDERPLPRPDIWNGVFLHTADWFRHGGASRASYLFELCHKFLGGFGADIDYRRERMNEPNLEPRVLALASMHNLCQIGCNGGRNAVERFEANLRYFAQNRKLETLVERVRLIVAPILLRREDSQQKKLLELHRIHYVNFWK